MNDPGLQRRRLGFWVAAVCVLALDLMSKHLAFTAAGVAAPGGLPLIKASLVFVRHLNRGMVWGLGSGHPLLIVGIVAMVAPCLALMAYACRAPGAPLWALGLILGGAAGNVYDRLSQSGVRDFVQVDLGVWPANPWPVFNLADVAIVAGFLVYTCWSIFYPMPRAEPHPGSPPGASTGPTDGKGTG